MPPQSSVSAIIKFASSSRLASSTVNRLCPTHHTRFVQPTSQVSRSLLRSSKKVTRVELIPKDRSQCLQVLEKEDAPLDNIGIELNATVIQKARKAVPMVES